MGRRRAAFAVLASLVLASTPARAGDVAGPRAFVAWIYSHYPAHGPGNSFDTLGPAMPKIFHPSLIELIKADQQAGDDEAPDLDGDPLCDCQDTGGMTFTIASVRTLEFSRATAVIIRRDVNGDDAITLDLAQNDGSWRVYDVETKDTPSLRAFLIKSIQDWKGH